MSIFTTAVCPLEEAQYSGVLQFWELNLLKVCIITHAFPYFVHGIYVSFSLDKQTDNLIMTSCRGYVESSLSCLWKNWQSTEEQLPINQGCSLTISVQELMLKDVSMSSFSTASTSPFSAASCSLVFFCPFLLQVILSISSPGSLSLSTHTRVIHKKVFVERESLGTRLDIDSSLATKKQYLHLAIYS